jgi:hypothetical protein
MTSFAAKSPVFTEMERRLKFLAPPQGTPPDLLAHPSPPITPFYEYPLSEFRPPVARPLFTMTGDVLDSDWVGSPAGPKPDQQIQDLSNEDWWRVFKARFLSAQKALSQEGFSPPEELVSNELWSIRGDRVVDGHVRIDIGALPIPHRHQRFWELRPHAFYINREVEFGWDYHPQYGGDSWTWGYHAVYGEKKDGTTVFKSSRPVRPAQVFIHATARRS